MYCMYMYLFITFKHVHVCLDSVHVLLLYYVVRTHVHCDLHNMHSINLAMHGVTIHRSV